MPEENSEIKIKQGEMGEHRIKIQTSPIDFMLRKITLDVADIPMMEYSKRFESRHNIDIYIDSIIDSYNKRDAEQFSLIQNKIKGSNLYDLDMEDKELAQTSSNGYSDNADNSVTTEKHDLENGNILGLLETSILWLEVINSNFNDLLGLVSASNYLAGISVLNTNTLEDINLILGGEPLGIKFVNEDQTVLGVLKEITPNLGFASSMESLVAGLEAILENTNTIVTSLEEILVNTTDIVDNTEKSFLDIIVGAISVGLGIIELGATELEGVVSALVISIVGLVKKYLLSSNEGIEFYEDNPIKLALSTYPIDIENTSTEQPMLQMLGVQNNGLQTTPMQDIYKSFELNSVNDNGFGGLLETLALSNYGNMVEQGNGSMQKAISEAGESCNIFIEVMDKIPTKDLAEIYTTVNNHSLGSLDNWNGVYTNNKLNNNSNSYVKPMVYSYTDENKTNQTTSEDIKNYMHNLNNVIPPTVENTYEIQVTNNFDMKITKDVDYHDITRYVTRSISNEILGLQAVLH